MRGRQLDDVQCCVCGERDSAVCVSCVDDVVDKRVIWRVDDVRDWLQRRIVVEREHVGEWIVPGLRVWSVFVDVVDGGHVERSCVDVVRQCVCRRRVVCCDVELRDCAVDVPVVVCEQQRVVLWQRVVHCEFWVDHVGSERAELECELCVSVLCVVEQCVCGVSDVVVRVVHWRWRLHSVSVEFVPGVRDSVIEQFIVGERCWLCVGERVERDDVFVRVFERIVVCVVLALFAFVRWSSLSD